jgi:hypothetical protein
VAGNQWYKVGVGVCIAENVSIFDEIVFISAKRIFTIVKNGS